MAKYVMNVLVFVQAKGEDNTTQVCSPILHKPLFLLILSSYCTRV